MNLIRDAAGCNNHCVAKRLELLIENRWLPRDYDIVAKFIGSEMVDGMPYAFFGAGTHTIEIIKRLEVEKVKSIKAVFDKKMSSGCLSEYKIPIINLTSIKEVEFDKIILSHNNFELTMLDDLRELGIDESKIVGIYSNPLYKEYVKNGNLLDKYIKLPINIPPDNKVIAFVSMSPMRIVDDNTLRLLKKKDRFYFVNLSMEREVERKAENNTAYDIVVDLKESFLLLIEWLKRIKPHIIYIYDHFTYSSLCYLVIRNTFSDMKVITELYDIFELYYDDPQILSKESYWKPVDVEVARHCERMIIKESEGLVYKEGGRLTKKFLSQREKPSLEFQQYASMKHIHFNERGVSYEPIRLVWTGTITPSQYSKKMSGENQLIDLFEILTRQGFSIAAFVNQKEDKLEYFYSDYIELSKKTKLFKLYGFVPKDRLLDIISKEYDYGIILGIFTDVVNRDIGFKTTIASKIFTYIAAGIPILVNREFEAMADIVESNGIGKAYLTEEIDNIYYEVKGLPYAKYKNNLKRLARRFTVEERIDDLYRTIMYVLNMR